MSTDNQLKLSIIVPVYNVEKYLSKCLDSLLAQTLAEFELILVDDGSKDSSGTICDQYAEKDARIRVIHKENGGLSDARNTGIDAARAPYIGFIDSDDYVDADMYELLYRLITQYEADVSICGLYHVYTDRTTVPYSTIEEKCIGSEEAIAIAMEGNKFSVTAVNKLYKKGMFDHLRFLKGKTAEDAFLTIPLFHRANCIAYNTTAKYYYVHRENSITTSTYKPSDQNVIEAYVQNYNLIMEHYPQLKAQAECRYYWAHFYVLDKMALSSNTPKEEKAKIVRELRKGFWNIMKNPFFTRNRKTMMLLLMMHSSLYCMGVRMMQKSRFQ